VKNTKDCGRILKNAEEYQLILRHTENAGIALGLVMECTHVALPTSHT